MDITYEQLMETQVTRLEDLFNTDCLDDTTPPVATQTQRIPRLTDLDIIELDMVPVASRICLKCDHEAACLDCAADMDPEVFGGY